MVESVAGQSPFTTDPRRHAIQDTQFSLSSDYRITQLLPDQRTALVLVESFFIGVGLFLTSKPVQIFRLMYAHRHTA